MNRIATNYPSNHNQLASAFTTIKQRIGLLAIVLSIMALRFSETLEGGTRIIDLEGTPGPIVAGNLNGDHHVDFIVGDQDREVVVVLLGEGRGQFSEADGSPHPANSVPEDLAIADFNGDGISDVAIANHDAPTLTLLLGEGDGHFTEASNSPVHVNSRPHPHGIAVGDFNLDGVMDMATESWEDDEVVVLYGSENLSFPKPHSRHSVGDFPYYKLRSGDLNGDDYIDLFTANWGSSSVSVLMANSNGNFDPSIYVPTPPSPFAVAIGDLNNDGHQDLATVHRVGNPQNSEADGFSVILGNGSGEFSLIEGSLPETGASPTSLAIGDLNGDDFEDIAIANYGSNDVTIILAKEGGFVLSQRSPISVGEGPVTVLLEDLNHDGMDDIVTTDSVSKSVSIIFAREE